SSADRCHPRAGDDRPIPGTLVSRSQPASRRARVSISHDNPSMRSSSRDQSPAGSSMTAPFAVTERQSAWPACPTTGTQEAEPLPHGNAALQQEGANLVDDTGALADQSLTHAVKRLQAELIVFVATHSSLGRCSPSAIACASRKSLFCSSE